MNKYTITAPLTDEDRAIQATIGASHKWMYGVQHAEDSYYTGYNMEVEDNERFMKAVTLNIYIIEEYGTEEDIDYPEVY